MRSLRRSALYRPLVLLTALCLGGCADQRILERIGTIQTTSYDLMPNGDLKVAVAIPRLEEVSGEQRLILSTTAPSIKQARIKMSQKTSLQLVNGQLRVSLLGKSLVEAGIDDHLDTLGRDPAISPLMKIAVVNGDAEKLLNKKYSQHPRTDLYIDQLLETEAETHAMPKATLHQFIRDYFDDGIDPVAPMIRKDGENIVSDGIAIFKGDKYVGRLRVEDSMIFSFLRGGFRQGETAFNLNSKGKRRESVMITSLVSRRSVKVKRSGGETSVVISIKIHGSVLEYIGDLQLAKGSDLKRLENRISAYLTGKAERMVSQMQAKAADSIGIGIYVRNSMSYSAWKRAKWEELYPRIKVNCKVEVSINNAGKTK